MMTNPVLSARVPEEYYAKIVAAAAISGRTPSQEFFWRVQQGLEFQAMFEAEGICPCCGRSRNG